MVEPEDQDRGPRSPDGGHAGNDDGVARQDSHPPGSQQPGSITEQDANTAPAPPTPAAARRRLIARDAWDRKRAEDARHAKVRRRVMIGSGVALGVVGIAAVVYWAAPGSSTTAHCVDDNNQPAPASYCDTGTHVGNFFFFGGSQYHYYYGGSVSSGGRFSGGSLTKPRSGTITTDSGKTIQRGGFGGRVSHGTS